MRRPGAPRSGAAAAELAIVLPFLLVLFVGVVDHCRVYHATQTVQQCAQAGAMYASGAASRDPALSAEQAAQDAAVAEGASLNPPLAAANVTVVISGGTATVTVRYPLKTITAQVGFVKNKEITRSTSIPLAPAVGS